jgi:hypothetical protein
MFRRLAFAGIAAVLSFSAALPTGRLVQVRTFDRAAITTVKVVRRPVNRQIAEWKGVNTSDGHANPNSFASCYFTLLGVTLAVSSEWSSSGGLESVAISAWYHRPSDDFTVLLSIAGPCLFMEFPSRGSQRSAI